MTKIFNEIQLHDVLSETLRISSVMLSWGIYGASVDWQQKSQLTAEQYIEMALPPIANGMRFINPK